MAAILCVNFLTAGLDGLSSSAGVDLQEKSRAVDKLFAAWDQPGTPGAIVGIKQGGRILHLKGYGRASIEFDLPWQPYTRSRIYSITKHFMGTAALILEDRGKLDLDDDVRKYLPELPDYGHKITLRHLLTNTSGLRDDEEILLLSGLMNGTPVSLEYMFKAVLKQKGVNFLPGAAYLYCNSGFRMMALIIERLSGKSCPQWMRENVFIPSGMTRTLMMQYDTQMAAGMASGYDKARDGAFTRARFGIGTSGDGAIVSTITDMMKWSENFKTNRLRIRDFPARLVRKHKLNNGYVSDYALGINIRPYRGLRTFNHGGGAEGYLAQFWYFPDQDFTIVILANRTDTYLPLKAQAAADIYLAGAMAKAEKKTGKFYKPERREMEKFKGLYVNPGAGLVVNVIPLNNFPTGELYFGSNYGVMKAIGPAEFETAVGYNAGTARFEFKEPGKRPLLHFGLGLAEPALFIPVSGLNLDAGQLREYAGVYKSDELENPVRVALKEGKLRLHFGPVYSPGQVAELKPVYADLFYGGVFNVSFLRDGSARVKGLQISTPRARYFKLERIREP